jgi:tRNA(Arg) A34 adenosine deaminase TadA
MCLGAIYWARPNKVFYACNKRDAADIDFDDQFIYDELDKKMDDREIKFVGILRQEGLSVFQKWTSKVDKKEY